MNHQNIPLLAVASVPKHLASKKSLALAFLFFGALFSVGFFLPLFSPTQILNMLLITALCIGELFIMVHAFGFARNIIKIKKPKASYQITAGSPILWPSVALLLPARNEPLALVEKTLATLSMMDYPNKKVYFIEDSTDPLLVQMGKEMAKKHNAVFFRPKNINGGKAGILNEFLKTMQEEYLAIFDADQNPFPSFLKETVSIALSNKNICFVQTPQFYWNTDNSKIARVAAMQQSIFFESIGEAKSVSNAMFCCGTNVLIRKGPLMEAGGFNELSITEDFDVSMKFHMLGYSSVYYNRVRVFGMAPESLSGYLKQQARWASGTTAAMVKLLKLFWTDKKILTKSQWWEYFLSASYYFIGWSFLLLMICPIAFLLIGLPTYFIHPAWYFYLFIPYYISVALIFYLAMKKRNYTFSQIYQGAILSSIIFPILIMSTVKGLFPKKREFEVTPKFAQDTMHFWKLWPWTAAILINLGAIVVGVMKFSTNPAAVSINISWCLYNIFIISHIYYLNK